jgi:hypothetical protein
VLPVVVHAHRVDFLVTQLLVEGQGVGTGVHMNNLCLRVLQDVTRVLQECYKGDTSVSQVCHNCVTRVLQECHKCDTSVSQVCHKCVTSMFKQSKALRSIPAPCLWTDT